MLTIDAYTGITLAGYGVWSGLEIEGNLPEGTNFGIHAVEWPIIQGLTKPGNNDVLVWPFTLVQNSS